MNKHDVKDVVLLLLCEIVIYPVTVYYSLSIHSLAIGRYRHITTEVVLTSKLTYKTFTPFRSHVIVAATGEAELSPTPTPFKIACVASVPVR